MNLRKMLFIQLKMLGDILMLTPSIKAFKRKYPDVELDVAVQTPGDVLLRRNPYVDNIVVLETRRWHSLMKQAKFIGCLRKGKYDMAIDFLGNPRSAHYTYLSGAGIRVGYSDASFKYAYNRTYERTYNYSAISKLEYLSFLNIDTSDYQPEFYLDPNVELPDGLKALGDKKLAAISPVSLRPSNIWPAANFAEISEYLFRKFNLHPVVIAGPGEQRFLDEFERYAHTPFTPLLIEDLMLLGDVLKRCEIFCGNDNGPRHIAVAMGLPTFTIHSHSKLSDPVCWNYPDPVRHQFIGGFNQPDCREISQITPSMVIAQMEPFMENMFKNSRIPDIYN